MRIETFLPRWWVVLGELITPGVIVVCASAAAIFLWRTHTGSTATASLFLGYVLALVVFLINRAHSQQHKTPTLLCEIDAEHRTVKCAGTEHHGRVTGIRNVKFTLQDGEAWFNQAQLQLASDTEPSPIYVPLCWGFCLYGPSCRKLSRTLGVTVETAKLTDVPCDYWNSR